MLQGLLKVSKSGEIKLLTESAEGQNFRLTDGVDIGDDGTIYFTDASHKYNFHQVSFDFLEGRPYGRFMSYNPSTLQTNVLLNDLYFPNGVAVSPDQNFVIFCETPLYMSHPLIYLLHNWCYVRTYDFRQNLIRLNDYLKMQEKMHKILHTRGKERIHGDICEKLTRHARQHSL